MRIIIFGFLLLALTGCATTISERAMRIREAQRSDVKDCRLLGEVKGRSGQGGLIMQEAGKNAAKTQALNQAGDMNATHIVWTLAEGGYFGGNAVGMAYDCKTN